MAPPIRKPPESPKPHAHQAPPFADPGKQERFSTGVPVVPAFDGYRGFAILGVVLFHILASSGLLLRAGERWEAQLVWGTLPYTISVFFIVSGFVMFLPVAARDGRFGSIGTFALRRAARLFPAFWLALLIALLLLAALPQSARVADGLSAVPMPGAGEILLNFSGQQTWATLFDPSQAPGFGVDVPVWTLTLEIAFYLVLPFIAASYFRRPLIGLAVAAGIAILWREAFANIIGLADLVGVSVSPLRAIQLQFTNNQFPYWAFSFGAGMTSAWAYVHLRATRDRAELERLAPRAAGVALVALAVCVYFAGRYAVGNPADAVIHLAWDSWPLIIAYTAALATFMLAVTFASERIQRPFSHPVVRLIADISYGVYLIHAVLMWVMVAHFGAARDGSIRAFVVLFLAVVPLSLVYGYLSARFVEQPIRRWAHGWARGRQARRGVEPASGASSPGLPERVRP
jgi:acetyltransferase